MKRLLLTSNGFENPKIGKEFLKLVNKPVTEIKSLFIPNASRTKEELHYISLSKKELIDLGIEKENIIEYNLDRDVSDGELENIDVVYMCGGNTFYLLYKVRESKFDEKINEIVNKGIVYVGVSAGSMIIGPDIDVSGIREEWDKNDIGIKDLTGLNLIKERISPHYINEDKEAIQKFERETGKKVTPLRDNQAILIKDNEINVIE